MRKSSSRGVVDDGAWLRGEGACATNSGVLKRFACGGSDIDPKAQIVTKIVLASSIMQLSREGALRFSTMAGIIFKPLSRIRSTNACRLGDSGRVVSLCIAAVVSIAFMNAG